MPITKVPIVHKFGILSQTHQHDLKERLTRKAVGNRDSNSPSKSRACDSYRACDLQHLVQQLNDESDNLNVFELQEKIIGYQQKLKFQLSSLDIKNQLAVLESCWSDLFLISTCKDVKLRRGALCLLQESLINAPLSKKLLKILLEIGVGCLQLVYLDEQVNSTNNRTLLKVTQSLYSRLYYHYLVNDITNIFADDMQSIIAMNDGLKKQLCEFQENPINYMMMYNIISMIDSISEGGFNESPQETVSESNGGLLPIHHMCNEDSILKGCLRVWYCTSRELPVPQTLIESILETQIKPHLKPHSWCCKILALHCLSECAKLKVEYVQLLLQLGCHMISQMSRDVSTNPPITRTDITENVDTSNELQSPSNKLDCKNKAVYVEKIEERSWLYVALYLHSLSQVVKHALTTGVKKIALLGTDNLHGLVEFLKEKYEWKVQYTCYQLLYDVYNHLKVTGDSVLNTVWYHISKNEDRRKHPNFLNIIKVNEVLNEDSKETCYGQLYSKISTNMCVVIFANVHCLLLPTNTHNIETEERERHESNKVITGQIMLPGNSNKRNSSKIATATATVKKSVFLPDTVVKPARHSTLKTSYEFDSTSELERVVSQQYHKEVLEDEIEREKMLDKNSNSNIQKKISL